MAEILPLRAWRYNKNLNIPMEELVSPLFDIADSDQLEKLYTKPYNSIQLTLSKKNNNWAKTNEILENWKSTGILLQDDEPGIYVFYQYFSLAGHKEGYCRKGFIAQVKAYDWEERIILRHEDTIASSVQERIDLLRNTQIQSSPTHGLYQDINFHLEAYMDEAIKKPLVDIKDYQGVREILARITDKRIINEFIRLIDTKKIILADGHHRLQAAIDYRNISKSQNPRHNGTEAYNYHMMYFTNSNSNNLKILPTHRLFKKAKLSESQLLAQLKRYFEISPSKNIKTIDPNNISEKWNFTLLTKDNAYDLAFKQCFLSEYPNSSPQIIKELDLSILHYFFVEKILEIPLDRQRYSDTIEYESNYKVCLQKLTNNEVDIVLLTRPLKMEQIIKVCNSGYTLPQKSTFFYPKLLSGLLFGSIKEKEFNYPYHNFK